MTVRSCWVSLRLAVLTEAPLHTAHLLESASRMCPQLVQKSRPVDYRWNPI